MPATNLDAEVKVSTSSAGLGRITLCRERQLNALGAAHVEILRQQLLDWAQPGSGVSCVLLDSNNDRSFCSGGPRCQADGRHNSRLFRAL
jgi:enoyl-CoA hydratase/carnithine racemase